MSLIYVIILLLVAAAVASFATSLLLKKNAQSKSNKILSEAEEKAEMIRKEKVIKAREEILQMKMSHEQEIGEKNNRMMQAESRLKQKEQQLNQRTEEINRKQKETETLRITLASQQESLTRKETELDRITREKTEILEKISGMTGEEARNQLIESMKDEARNEALSYIKDIMDEARITAQNEAKKIVIETIQIGRAHV